MSDAFEEFGPYLVYERLGQGGMATVHRAEKRGTGIRKPIALKRLLPHVADDPDLVKLFVDEARLASRLHHANVAQTYELGIVDDVYFIAMEYASGPTLSQVVRQCQLAAGPIPTTITVNIVAQVCEALDYAHNLCDDHGEPLRMIHRDVSPGNIIVTHTGLVKLIDFGIAKATISRNQTQAGYIKGKLGYIAPEYISGQIDKRADLFAVGVVAHELLSGRRLFEGRDDFETLQNIRDMKLSPPSRFNADVPPELDDIVMTALTRDPEKRWQSASAMQIALQKMARNLGPVVGGPQLAEWIEWAFRQVPQASLDSGPVMMGDAGLDGGRGERRAGSSLSISVHAAELEDPGPPSAAPAPTPAPSAAPAAASAPPPSVAQGRHAPRKRPDGPALDLGAELDAYFDMDTPPPELPIRPALSPEVLASAARRAQPTRARPARAATHRAALVPAPEEPTPHPSRDASDASDELDAADRADRRRLLWGILLMLALGLAAMAATYYWPDL